MAEHDTPTRDFGTPRTLKAALSSFAAGGLVYAGVATGLVRDLDIVGLALLRASETAPRWWLEALRDITALGSFAVLGLAVLMVTSFLLARHRPRLAGLFLASALGATGFSSFLKWVVDRARPESGEALVVTFTRSFPSGHSLLTAAILLTMAGFLCLATHGQSARRVVWTSGILLCAMVGLSRIVLGVHWPSDVLAGWLFGLGWALLTLHLASRATRVRHQPEPIS